MLDSIMNMLQIPFKSEGKYVDIAKGKYKLPETYKELRGTIKTIKKEWKSLRLK